MWLTPEGCIPEKTRSRRPVTMFITPRARYRTRIRGDKRDAPEADYRWRRFDSPRIESCSIVLKGGRIVAGIDATTLPRRPLPRDHLRACGTRARGACGTDWVAAAPAWRDGHLRDVARRATRNRRDQ